MKFRVVESNEVRHIGRTLNEGILSEIAADIDKAAKAQPGSGVKIKVEVAKEASSEEYVTSLLEGLYSYNMKIRDLAQSKMAANPGMTFQEAKDELGAPFVNLMLAGIPGAAKTAILNKWVKTKVVRPSIDALRTQADRYDHAADSGHPEVMEKTFKRLNLLTKFVSSMEPEDIGGQVVLTTKMKRDQKREAEAAAYGAGLDREMSKLFADEIGEGDAATPTGTAESEVPRDAEELAPEDVLTRVPTKEYDKLRTTNPNEKPGASNDDLYVLFLDEYNRGADKVRGTLLELINNHIIPWGEEGTMFMDKLLFTVAAINPSTAGEAGANELGGAEMGRFLIVEFTPTKTDTMKHLVRQRFGMVNLLSQRVEKLMKDCAGHKIDTQSAAEAISDDITWMQNWTRQVFIVSKIFQGKRILFDNVETWGRRTSQLPPTVYAYAINSPRSYDIATAFTDGTKEDLLKHLENTPLGHYNKYDTGRGGAYDMLDEIRLQLDDYVDPTPLQIKGAIKEYAGERAAAIYEKGIEYLYALADSNPDLEKYVIEADFVPRPEKKVPPKGAPDRALGDEGGESND